MNHVLRASRNALGPASTAAVAVCHAPHHVTGSPAISVAPENSLADTNAREFAAKRVLKTTVRYVPNDQTLEWISWK
jgi:hypothetical protein